MRVQSLHIHPVKSLRAVDVDRAQVVTRGFVGDRRWMVVNEEGMFLTQRSHPQLATLTAKLTAQGIELSAEGYGSKSVDKPDGALRRRVIVWDSEVDAADAGDEAANWLSNAIGDHVRLVCMDEAADRLKISVWTNEPVPMSFADAFPVLVVTTGSLAALNSDIEKHGGAPVTIGRFRPNAVIDCEAPFAEDNWKRIQVGDVVFDLVKPSDRCIVTTTDQRTGARMGKEPLAALARIHRSKDPRINGVIFGENAVPRNEGEIRIGDAVSVVEERAVAGVAS